MEDKKKNIYVYIVMGIALTISAILKFLTLGWVTIILMFCMVLPAYYGLYCVSAILTANAKKKHLILFTINSIIFSFAFLFWQDAADNGSNTLIKNVDPNFTRWYILLSLISTVVLSIVICVCAIIDIVKENKKRKQEKEMATSLQVNDILDNNINNNINNNIDNNINNNV